MKTNAVIIDAGHVNFPLAPLAVGRNSSAIATVCGDIPDDIERIAVIVEYMAGGVKSRYSAAASRQTDGSWKAYLAPVYFPEADNSLKYHVAGTDALGNPRWLGSGILRIMDTPLDDPGVAPVVVPDSDIRIALYGLADDTLADTASQKETREMVQKILAVLKAAAAGSTSGVDPVNRRTVVYDDSGEPHFMSVVRDDAGELTSVFKE